MSPAVRPPRTRTSPSLPPAPSANLRALRVLPAVTPGRSSARAPALPQSCPSAPSANLRGLRVLPAATLAVLRPRTRTAPILRSAPSAYSRCYARGPVDHDRTPDDPRPDALLIASINAGRREDVAVLYHRYSGWVYRLALRFTADPDAASDVLQETFLYLLRRLPTLRLHAKLTTFLYPAVKNIAITAARRRRRDTLASRHTPSDPAATAPPSEGDTPFDRASPAPDPTAPDHDRRTALSAAVGALPDGQREVLLMRIVDEMAVAEIAAALDIPAGTVKSRLHHALATLRNDPRTGSYFE